MAVAHTIPRDTIRLLTKVAYLCTKNKYMHHKLM
jgi:hypothetical protein